MVGVPILGVPYGRHGPILGVLYVRHGPIRGAWLADVPILGDLVIIVAQI